MNSVLEMLRDPRFMPHGHCYLWTPDVLWLNVVSDSIIAFSYYSIPIALMVFVRSRKDVAFTWVFVLFAIFILACGTTHIIEVWNVWHSDYRFAGYVKAFTALVSIVTAILLWPLLPQALKLPSPRQLEEKNQELKKEVKEREHAEAALKELNTNLEMRIQERTEELGRSNRDLELFAYVASHDLQQPARTISGMIDLLSRKLDGKLDRESAEYMNLTRHASVKMTELIRALLDYSRLNSRPSETVLVDCNEVMKEAGKNLASTIENTEMNLDVGTLPIVKGDRMQLIQLFQNLLGNAVKYRTKVRPCIIVSAEELQSEWILHFQDNGIGIDPKYHERIFDMFKRLHSDEEYPGTGMGLAICKRIAENHGGSIKVKSEIGKGARFSVSLEK